MAGLKLDQNVDVAVRTKVFPQDRSEDCQTRDVVALAER